MFFPYRTAPGIPFSVSGPSRIDYNRWIVPVGSTAIGRMGFPERTPDVAAEEFIPKWLAWEVTGRCNLNCIHCRASASMTSHDTDFTTEEAKRFIDDITSFCSPVLVLSGGEPLLRPDLFEIAAYGTSKGLRMCIATNGTLVTDEVCGRMRESGIKIVSLSLDGSTAAVHDDFRKQPGAFEATLRAAETFTRNGIKFLVNSSFAKRNQHDIPATYRLATRIGAHA